MAQDEKSIHKIQRLIDNRDNVRNIATSAHIHHGKCIGGNSRLLMPNGNVKTAKEIFEEVSKDGKVYKDNEDYTIFIPKHKVEVFSLNKESGSIEKKELEYVWRLNGGNAIKVSLRNGFQITTTPEHKYIVFKDEIKEIEAKDLKIGDRIICSRKLNISNNINIKEEIILKLSEKNFYVKLNKKFSEELKEKILSYGIKNIKLSIKSKSFYHGVWQDRYNLSDLIEICRILDINLNYIYDKVDLIFFRTGKQRGHNSTPMKMPNNFDDLFYLAGLFIGDGSGKKFIVGKEKLADKFNRICDNLGINTIRVERKDRTPEIHTNLTLINILNSLFDYPLKQKSHNVHISEFVWRNENRYISKLLRGYFDTDGCVESSRRAVTITSTSKKMIDDLHLLLVRFGCLSIKEKDNTITISGTSAINFEREIGFGLTEKKEKLKTLVKKVSGSIVCDTIKIGNQVMIINKKLKDFNTEELAYIEVKKIEADFEEVVYDFSVPENHNFIAEGMIIHNTALTDNLLAAAGMMASKAAGNLDEGMVTWQHADEQERLMTVDAANVSMGHNFHGEEFLINLIDTPGHVDFSGNVTRAMRAIDGTIVLVCASEGIMPQTETVLKQALKERVRPVLFINKVDRLIKELKMTPEQMQERFLKIFKHFNELIEKIAEPEYKQKWKVDINDGSVAFGSARENWALSLPFMKKKGVSFKDIFTLYEMSEEDKKEWTWKNAPLYEVLLDMVVKHLPSPIEAQKYRIPRIWKGDPESEFGKNLINCNPNGDPAFVITRIVIDPRSGKEISAGRLFSGKLEPGMEVYLNNGKKKQRIQQVLVYNGIKPEQVERVSAGNVLAIAGIVADVGETITLKPETPFEEIKHIFEPVITKAIEPKRMIDLPKLVEVLRKVKKEDPSLKIEINEETGENLISGMGELHLEIVENRIVTEKGLEIKTSSPIVVYRETAMKESPAMEGRSPNKHNSFFMRVEPLEDSVYQAFQRGDLPGGRIKKKNEEITKVLLECGISNDEIRSYRGIYKGNVITDETRGEVHMIEVIELILDAFEQVMDAGPLAREPCTKMKISIADIKLHEDAIHRGPAQVYPAVRDAISEAMKSVGITLLEPLQTHEIEAPNDFMGAVTKLVSQKRGQLIDVEQDEFGVKVKAKIPVAEMLGWSSDLRSATEGRGISNLMDQSFEAMPRELQAEVVRKIRTRKGLAENQ